MPSGVPRNGTCVAAKPAARRKRSMNNGRSAGARRAVEDGAARLPAGVHEGFHGLVFRIGRDDERYARERGDGGEILGHVERQAGIGGCHHDVRCGVHQQGVAVGFGFRDQARADRRAGAAAILDDEGLAGLLADLLEHGARGDVGGAAGGERHDDPDRLPGRPVLCRRGCRSDQQTRGQRPNE